MARPVKENADWFQHDADASNDMKIMYLESKFGALGYAFYFKMLEQLTRANGFEIQVNAIWKSVFTSQLGCDLKTLDDLLKESTRDEIQAFSFSEDGQRVFSPGLLKRMSSLIQKRKSDRKRQRDNRGSRGDNRDVKSENPDSRCDNSVVTDENAQSRVEKSREEKSTGEKSTDKDLSETPEAPPDKPPAPPKLIPYRDRIENYFSGGDTEQMNAVWSESYPLVDLGAEIKKAKAWLISNPRKTKKNFRAFLNNWLAKAQQEAARSRENPPRPAKRNWAQLGLKKSNGGWDHDRIKNLTSDEYALLPFDLQNRFAKIWRGGKREIMN